MAIGIVEDNLDPKEEGRLKVRVCGITDQKDENGEYLIPTAILPWARSGCITPGGQFSVPKIGTAVYVDSRDLYNPIWNGLVYLDKDAKTEIGDDKNAHTLIYDTDFGNGEGGGFREGEHIKVYFTESKGFVIDYKTAAGRSKVSVQPNGDIRLEDNNGDTITMSGGTITIKCDNCIRLDAPKVELGQNATDGIIKSEAFREIFETHTHLYESGETRPPKAGMNPSVINQKVSC
jgi:hypothetical protein